MGARQHHLSPLQQLPAECVEASFPCQVLRGLCCVWAPASFRGPAPSALLCVCVCVGVAVCVCGWVILWKDVKHSVYARTHKFTYSTPLGWRILEPHQSPYLPLGHIHKPRKKRKKQSDAERREKWRGAVTTHSVNSEWEITGPRDG